MITKPFQALAAGAIGLAALTAPAPVAHAYEVRHAAKVVCRGISPNVVDNPYAGRITTTQWLPKEHGRITIYVSQSASLFGYQSRPRLAWHNLTSGQRGHTSTIAYSNREGEGASVISLRTGAGRVKLTMYAKNSNRFVSARSTACATTVRVR